MISKTAEYALRAMAYLAEREGTFLTTAQIADATQTPGGYLAKVMETLCRVGLVRSQRGLKGGFTLNRDASSLTFLEIINAVDPIRQFHECPLGLPTHGDGLCPLHHRLNQIAQTLEKFFADTTVAQVLNMATAQRSLCRLSSAPKAAT